MGDFELGEGQEQPFFQAAPLNSAFHIRDRGGGGGGGGEGGGGGGGGGEGSHQREGRVTVSVTLF